MTHYCRHLSSIILNSPCENENQSLESLAEFLREIEPSFHANNLMQIIIGTFHANNRTSNASKNSSVLKRIELDRKKTEIQSLKSIAHARKSKVEAEARKAQAEAETRKAPA